MFQHPPQQSSADMNGRQSREISRADSARQCRIAVINLTAAGLRSPVGIADCYFAAADVAAALAGAAQ